MIDIDLIRRSIVLLFLMGVLASSCGVSTSGTQEPLDANSPGGSRDFFMGLVPSPRPVPEASFEFLAESYQ